MLRGFRQARDVLFVGVSHGSPPQGLPNAVLSSFRLPARQLLAVQAPEIEIADYNQSVDL
jgi:hypothetical protein